MRVKSTPRASATPPLRCHTNRDVKPSEGVRLTGVPARSVGHFGSMKDELSRVDTCLARPCFIQRAPIL